MNFKSGLVGFVIFGMGAGTGYFVCKRHLVAQYKQDVTDVKQFYLDKVEELGVMPATFEPVHIIETDEDDEPEEHIETDEEAAYNAKVLRYSGALRKDTDGNKGKPIIKYNKPPLKDIEDWGDIEDDEDDDEDEMDLQYEAELEKAAEEFAERKHENKSNGLPYVIDFNEYMDGPLEYEKITLYYYAKDRVLCEDNDSEVDDEEGVMGFDYEDVLDMQTCAWVRNDTLMTMYEIHRVDESYKKTVLGAVETPREREFRISGRRKQALDNCSQ